LQLLHQWFEERDACGYDADVHRTGGSNGSMRFFVTYSPVVQAIDVDQT
jgi:hypothetical protein